MSDLKITSMFPQERDFFSKVRDIYLGRAENQIPEELLVEIISKVTDKLFDDYVRFWNQYPKSRKRYSTLKTEDIDHPFVQYLVTDFIKKVHPNRYREYSKVLLQMDDKEFEEYEKRKHWYETK